jgi:hypothetical protein
MLVIIAILTAGIFMQLIFITMHVGNLIRATERLHQRIDNIVNLVADMRNPP